MRGLQIRMAYASAKVMSVIDTEKAKHEFCEVLFEANLCGYDEYSSGMKEPPTMFLDEPQLLKAWWNGWNFHSEAEEMQYCPECNNQYGAPCSHHD
ncbi:MULTISPECIES: hypothetical protein [Photorhabdus]|uniref:Uncharacterized protein n=2 Tax=Photorhabdus TaxID=29487 RepID=A0A7X5QPY2_9GAMM|nr:MULTISPECIES: hypothetical protein [Photorhabdus]MQL50085.1 hypothetical protein [Photorhabdus khanii]NHB98376.1 hypothetical protein [Photorhabdus stackebrandtii]